MVDPLDIVARLLPSDTVEHNNKTVFRFNQQALDQRETFIKEESWKKQDPTEETQAIVQSPVLVLVVLLYVPQ